MDLISTDSSAQRYAIPKATLLFMVPDERHSRVDILNRNVPIYPARSGHVWLLFSTTVVSGSRVGARE